MKVPVIPFGATVRIKMAKGVTGFAFILPPSSFLVA